MSAVNEYSSTEEFSGEMEYYPKKKSHSRPLVLLLSVFGGIAVIGALVGVIICVCKKDDKKKDDENHGVSGGGDTGGYPECV